MQRRILSSITVVLMVLTTTLTATSAYLIYRRMNTNVREVLDTALAIAWQEYTSRPRHALTVMQYLMALPDFEHALRQTDKERLGEFLRLLPNVDFASVVSPLGEVVAHTNPARVGAKSPFASLALQVIREHSPKLGTEVIDAQSFEREAPSLARQVRIVVRNSGLGGHVLDRAMVQVVGVPALAGTEQYALMAGILLNNTSHIPLGYSARVRNSYLSISCDGVRVSSNIRSDAGPVIPGTLQQRSLVSTVAGGNRYFGLVRVGHEVHFVASDPIVDSNGKNIGALSVGLPPAGFVALQRETLIAILACAFLSFLLAVGVAALAAKHMSRPIVWLERVARELAACQEANEYDHTLARIEQETPAPYSREAAQLYESFVSMARELGRKYRETVEYLDRLEEDRQTLRRLTTELQEANALLEKKVEERTRELREAVLELRQANAHKSQFLAMISHELRTPLNSVIGFAEMLVDGLVGELNGKQKEYLDYILASARHLLELINDILDLTRIEQGRMVLDRQQVLLSDLISSIQAVVSHQAHARGLTLEVSIPDTVPPLLVDPVRVKQVLYNLLSNAIKFTPPGGRIWLRAWREGPQVAVEVQDTGIGIRQEDQHAVFNEFVQAESTYRRRFEGVGLGLPLSKKLVELHGGRIHLESEVGKGTKVRVYLPLPAPS
jgi:signal transduction histidine kinase